MESVDARPWDLASCLRRAARVDPRKAFLAGPEPITYGVLLDRIARLGTFFRACGLDRGRVAIATRDDGAAVVLHLALVCAGLTAVLLDPQAPRAEAGGILAAADPCGLFIDADLHEAWQPALTGKTVLIRPAAPGRVFARLLKREPADPDAYPGLLACHPPQAAAAGPGPDVDAYILFTSGTTARPRGVRISHGALAAHLGTLSRQFGYSAQSRILNVLPLHHADGLVQGAYAAFANGATLHRPAAFSIQALPALLDCVCAERISHFVAVPAILALLLRMAADGEDAFASPEFRCVVSTVAHLEQALWEGFEARFRTRVANVYGLTETVAGSLFSGPGEDSHRPGTIGKPVDCLARIVDPEGRELPGPGTGELLVSGPHLMSGYCGDPAGTAAALAGGWLRTGDVASRDGEGFYRILGRKKTVIIAGGLNLHPEEVSECLDGHPQVLESITFGVPDEVWGERVVAAVVAAPPAPTEADLIAHLRARLTSFKVPGRIHFLESFPKGPSGKVILEQVRARVAGAPAGPDPRSGLDLPDRIRGLAAEVFRVPGEALSFETGHQATPGWDSMAHLAFIVSLEEAFRVQLSAGDILRIATLADAVRVVRERLDA